MTVSIAWFCVVYEVVERRHLPYLLKLIPISFNNPSKKFPDSQAFALKTVIWIGVLNDN